MTLVSGTTVGSYEIVAPIGAGGMGEVWRARDSRIGREVAIKVMPPAVARDADRLQRFEQEARAAGTLNHPNLVTIYELGTYEGAPFIAMELLEGETLRDKLGNAPAVPAGEESGTRPSPSLPARKAIDYAIQLANGLDVAHERGVIHRDLKPENLFVTKDGRVKILDFGLAKLSGSNEGGETSESKTQQRGTAPGTVMGTAGYMSPEQVRGQQIDHRSDIFSLGAVLYEMFSGRRAFHADSSVETMNAILHNDPPELAGSGVHVSPGIDRIIRRCLEKDRAERFHSARDIAFALEAVSGSSSASTPAIAAGGAALHRRRVLSSAAAVLMLMLLTAAATVAVLGGRSQPAGSAMTFKQLTFNAGPEIEPALAPDGKTFAFARRVEGQLDLFVQRVDGQSAINVTRGSPADDSQPAFSPDGSRIAFRSERDGGGIFLVGATGESVRRLTDKGFNPAWSPDGTKIVFATERVNNPRSRSGISSLHLVDAGSGATRMLFRGDAVQPRWSPDGSRIAFWSFDVAGNREIQTISSTPGESTRAVNLTMHPAVDWNPVWSPDGRAIYFLSDRDGTMNLWRIAPDAGGGNEAPPAEPLRLPSTEVGYLSPPSSDGRLLFQSVSTAGELRHVGIDPAGMKLIAAAEPPLAGSMLVRTAAMSPDSSSIAFTTEGRQEDVYVMRADGTEIRQLTNDPARDRGVSWWPDGSRIAFYSNREDTYEAWSIRPDGSGLTRLTRSTEAADATRGLNFPRVSPDGRKLAYLRLTSGGVIADTAGSGFLRNEQQLPRLPGGGLFWPTSWSPDGKRLLGVPWNDRSRVYIYTLATKKFDLVSAGVGGAWLSDSKVVILSERGEIFVRELDSGETRTAGRIDWLDDVPGWQKSQFLEFSASGRHLLVARPMTEADIWLTKLGAEE